MAVDVIMPQMGESIFEGTITKWLKKPGDRIERDEPLFEISTDKVDAEIPAPSAGVLKEIKVSEGQTVPIQTVVAVIDAVGESASAPAAAPAPAPYRPPPQFPRHKDPKRPRPRRPHDLLPPSLQLPLDHRPLHLPGHRPCRAPLRRVAATARRFAALRLVRRLAKENTWISRASKAAARADASARKTFWRRWNRAARGLRRPHQRQHRRWQLLPPSLRDHRWFLRARAAPWCTRRWKTPSRASAFISAATTRSR